MALCEEQLLSAKKKEDFRNINLNLKFNDGVIMEKGFREKTKV